MRKSFKFLLWKAYFDKGMQMTNYVKYALGLLAFFSYSIKWNPMLIVILGIAYMIACLVVGRLWFKYKLIEVENEVANMFNPLSRELREHMKSKKV